MGMILLIIVFASEVGLAAYSLVTRADQDRTRSLVRIGMLAGFILLSLGQVIVWGLRWYLVGGLLLIWAAMGAWKLMGSRAETVEYKPGRSVRRAVGAVILFFAAVTPALVFPQYQMPPSTGPFAVASESFTYIDEKRTEYFSDSGANRKLNLECWYPEVGEGKYPLVVFSHGAFGTVGSNTTTYLELASHGYVVCSIGHSYHSFFTTDTDGRVTLIDLTFMQEVMDANTVRLTEEESYHLTQKWLKLRTGDIHFILDRVLGQVNAAGAEGVFQRIDTGRIGLMGHSLGGAASAQVARERADIAAVINLDGDLLGEYVAYTEGGLGLNDQAYPTPILNILSDDLVRLIDRHKAQGEVYAVRDIQAVAPYAEEVHLEGSNHMSLTDLPLVSPFLAGMIGSSVEAVGGQGAAIREILGRLNAVVLGYFDRTLKGR